MKLVDQINYQKATKDRQTMQYSCEAVSGHVRCSCGGLALGTKYQENSLWDNRALWVWVHDAAAPVTVRKSWWQFSTYQLPVTYYNLF